KPRLANIVGGLSGPAIRPVAVKMIWDAARVLRIPIIGTGGISDAASAIEFLLAGATAVSVGSMSFRQPDIALRVVEGIEDYLRRHNIPDVKQIIGAMEA
ncbi:MAG: dihydroorotate dehydrogenase, partial [Candidatus Hydrogenedentes bacterium]|nr:dihydroorotate dehydrogenase [Candidatus Hydrogenedentota bacterium]